jgi:hypothetical protein
MVPVKKLLALLIIAAAMVCTTVGCDGKDTKGGTGTTKTTAVSTGAKP